MLVQTWPRNLRIAMLSYFSINANCALRFFFQSNQVCFVHGATNTCCLFLCSVLVLNHTLLLVPSGKCLRLHKFKFCFCYVTTRLVYELSLYVTKCLSETKLRFV